MKTITLLAIVLFSIAPLAAACSDSIDSPDPWKFDENTDHTPSGTTPRACIRVGGLDRIILTQELESPSRCLQLTLVSYGSGQEMAALTLPEGWQLEDVLHREDSCASEDQAQSPLPSPTMISGRIESLSTSNFDLPSALHLDVTFTFHNTQLHWFHQDVPVDEGCR